MQNIKYKISNTQMKIHKYKYTTKGRTACVAQPACRADVRFRGKANLGCWSLLVGQIQTVAESEADSIVQLRVWYRVVWCVMVWYGTISYIRSWYGLVWHVGDDSGFLIWVSDDTDDIDCCCQASVWF